MDTRSYWGMVFRRAITETCSHARKKLLLGLVMAILATVLQFALNVRSLTDSEKIAISLFGSAIVVTGGSFLWNLVRIPAILHVDPPKRTPVNERHYQEAKTALEELGQEAIIILRHLKKHGELTFRMSSSESPGPPYTQSPLPEGINATRTYVCLEACARKSLVSPVHRTVPLGAIYPVTYIDYRIAEGMKEALDELLYA